MMRRALAIVLSLLLTVWPTTLVWAQSGGNCSVFRSWITGDSLTAGDLTSTATNDAVTTMTQACIDGISDTVAGMQTTTDPFASQTESLATSGAGEIQRLRFILERIFGISNWYRHDQNINFGGIGVTKTNVQGSGFGQHVTAVGLHTWSGSQRFPIFTSTNSHTTGLFWPAAHHLAIAIDPANDADKAGIEMFRFHAQGMTLHHTAAIMFRHSAAWNPQWQYPHITAISLSRGLVSAAGNEAAGRDTLLFGHAGTTLQMVGYGRSHVTLGSGAYVALGQHVGTLSPAAPVANALYGSMIVKAWAKSDGAANTGVDDGFNVASITRPDTGQYIITWDRDFATANYAVLATGIGPASIAVVVTIESQATTHAVVRTWVGGGAPGNANNSAFNVLAIGAQ